MRADFLAVSKDYICWYAKDRDAVKFRRLFAPKQRGDEGATQFQYVESPDGAEWRPIAPGDDVDELEGTGWRVFAHDNLTSTGFATTTAYDATWEGRVFRLPAANIRWKTTPDGMERLTAAKRLMAMGNTLRYKRYLMDFPVFTACRRLERHWYLGIRREEVVRSPNERAGCRAMCTHDH